MIPPPAFFQYWFEHVVWADNRQLDAVRALPAVEHGKQRGFSFGTIVNVLAHQLATESIWLDRFEQTEPIWLADGLGLGSVAEIEQTWPKVHQRGREFIASLTPQTLAEKIAVSDLPNLKSVALWKIVFHMCQHATYHRGQLNSMIKQAGGTSVAVDFDDWVALQS